VVIVVAGHHQHLSRADHRRKLGEERPGDVEGLGQRPVPKLDRVAEQHHPVGPLELAPQHLAEVRAAKQVDRPARSEVKVGDDHRAHPPILPPGEAKEKRPGPPPVD
jgi:hypothetical protein